MAVMLDRQRRLLVPIALLVLAIGIVLLLEPMPQDPAYHRFADTREFLGVPNFLDVFSNAGFLLVGLFALAVLLRQRASLFSGFDDARPYLIFFGAVTLIAVGSGYYHWNPSNETLLWDRLPMSVAYMAFSAAVVADRISARAGNGWLLAVLLVVGVSSLAYWYWSEANGRGDLRFYILVQFYPVLALPIIARTFPDYRYVPGRYLAWVIAWFLVSKVLEHLDHEIFAQSGELVSGHSLKHLASAVAAWLVFRMLTLSADSSARMATSRTG